MPTRLDIEGVTLILHFIVSALVVLCYVWLKANGIDDETLQFAVAGVIGYWFGATGKAVISKNKKAPKDDESP